MAFADDQRGCPVFLPRPASEALASNASICFAAMTAKNVKAGKSLQIITSMTPLIRENWDDLLRLVATIKLKENTASDIFRRLNSYSRQHALYQTLKAFG